MMVVGSLCFNLRKVPGAWSLLPAMEAERRGGDFAIVAGFQNLKEQKTFKYGKQGNEKQVARPLQSHSPKFGNYLTGIGCLNRSESPLSVLLRKLRLRDGV